MQIWTSIENPNYSSLKHSRNKAWKVKDTEMENFYFIFGVEKKTFILRVTFSPGRSSYSSLEKKSLSQRERERERECVCVEWEREWKKPRFVASEQTLRRVSKRLKKEEKSHFVDFKINEKKTAYLVTLICFFRVLMFSSGFLAQGW